jgi:hypothetical protein
MLEEGEQPHGSQRQQLGFLVYVVQDGLVDAEGGGVDAGGEGGVEALGESFGEGELVGEGGAAAGREYLEEAVEPIAEVGPLPVLFEVAEDGVDVPAQVL